MSSRISLTKVGIIIFQYEQKLYGCKKEKTELTVAVTGIKVVRKETGKRNWITQNVCKFLVTTTCTTIWYDVVPSAVVLIYF